MKTTDRIIRKRMRDVVGDEMWNVISVSILGSSLLAFLKIPTPNISDVPFEALVEAEYNEKRKHKAEKASG